MTESQPSAFPKLRDDITELPTIPGGWKVSEFDVGTSVMKLTHPADPDCFLDDADVIAANNQNDYMPYWTYLWPSAIKMAKALEIAPWKVGTSVLELGAGVGLVGLAAQARGDLVTYSDYDATALYICRWNAKQNGLDDPRALTFDWREPIEERFPVVIGCEVTYDAAMHEVILDLLERILEPNGTVWLGDPGRYQSPFFYEKARLRGYGIRILNEHGNTIEKPSSEGFQIFEMKRETND